MHQSGEGKRTPGYRLGSSVDWRDRALCRGTVYAGHDPWDADPRMSKAPEAVKSFCSRCPVRQPCLLAGLENDERAGAAYLIWGGLAPRERRSLVRKRKRKYCPVCRGGLIADTQDANVQICLGCGVAWQSKR